ncbi:MAG: hypothetical protein MH472_09295 [Bacteroidia bacterium]|nr:hypothetical protein [Bacteroidia bacterium]
MPNNYSNKNASGLIFTLAFLGFLFLAFFIVLFADIEVGAFLEGQLESTINSEIESRVGSSGVQSAKASMINKAAIMELKNAAK